MRPAGSQFRVPLLLGLFSVLLLFGPARTDRDAEPYLTALLRRDKVGERFLSKALSVCCAPLLSRLAYLTERALQTDMTLKNYFSADLCYSLASCGSAALHILRICCTRCGRPAWPFLLAVLVSRMPSCNYEQELLATKE